MDARIEANVGTKAGTRPGNETQDCQNDEYLLSCCCNFVIFGRFLGMVKTVLPLVREPHSEGCKVQTIVLSLGLVLGATLVTIYVAAG